MEQEQQKCHGKCCSKDQIILGKVFELPWAAGRAAQSHHPGTEQEEMNMNETKQRLERKRKEVGGQNLNQLGC